MTRTQDKAADARRLIPGGTQLLSKRPEMFAPGQWPMHYSTAKGCRVWDLDGREYTDMSMMGVGACVLGYADPDVDAAVSTAVSSGVSSTLNCPEEVELAELLCRLHPWADRVRYARGGGEAMAVAVRIARAHTRREKVAFCGYHGWHDWYLAANLGKTDRLDGHLLPGLEPRGVPRGLRGTALPFHFNRAEELEAIVEANPDRLAAIVLEPARSREPNPNFLARVRKLADEAGAVLVYDEVSAGFRMTLGGIHLKYGIDPDIAVFAKGMSNGYAMAAILGRSGIMDAAQESFISSTSWTERIGPTAAIATIGTFERLGLHRTLVARGRAVQKGWAEAAGETGVGVEVDGIPPLAHFGFGGDDGLAAATLFRQEMLAAGFLASDQYYASLAHTEQDVNAYLEAVTRAMDAVGKARRDGGVAKRLRGPIAHAGFRRIT